MKRMILFLNETKFRSLIAIMCLLWSALAFNLLIRRAGIELGNWKLLFPWEEVPNFRFLPYLLVGCGIGIIFHFFLILFFKRVKVEGGYLSWSGSFFFLGFIPGFLIPAFQNTSALHELPDFDPSFALWKWIIPFFTILGISLGLLFEFKRKKKIPNS